MAMTRVEAIYLSKKFLREEIFRKYPKIAQPIMEGSKNRYMQNIRQVISNQRMSHLKEVNAQSRYKTFSIKEKNSITEKIGEELGNMFSHRIRKMKSTHIDLKTPMGSIISAPLSQSNQNPRSHLNVTTKIDENSNSNETCSDSVKSSIKDLFNPKGNCRTDLAFIIRQRL